MCEVMGAKCKGNEEKSFQCPICNKALKCCPPCWGDLYKQGVCGKTDKCNEAAPEVLKQRAANLARDKEQKEKEKLKAKQDRAEEQRQQLAKDKNLGEKAVAEFESTKQKFPD